MNAASLSISETIQPYRPVRALNRGLNVLQAINQFGSATLSQISQATNLPYATIIRLVNTLIEAGFVEKEPNRKNYRPTLMVKTLASGMNDDSLLVSVARPHIEYLTSKFGWPVSIATRVGNKMVLQDSTHGMTSLTFWNYNPGYSLPLAECATGKVSLAYCDEAELNLIRKGFAESSDQRDKASLLLTGNSELMAQVKRNGYATQSKNSFTRTPGKTSSIAVPIIVDGSLCGTMAVIFFSAGLSMSDAEGAFVAELQQAAQRIAMELGQATTDMAA